MASPPLPPVLSASRLGPAADSINAPSGRTVGGGPILGGPPPITFPPRFIRGGCWLLSYEPRNTTARYDGTLRIENHQPGGAVTGRTASGDLYLRQNTLLANNGGGHVTVNLPSPNPANGIPIFPRNKYTYYIRVTKIDEEFSFGSKFTLELEFYRFAQTTPLNFSFVLEDTHTVSLTWKTAPAGYPSGQDYAEGDVTSHKTGEIAGRIKLGWLSDFYRKISLEIDTVNGAAVPLANGGTPTAENWTTIFDRVGYQFHQFTSQRDIPDTTQGPWDSAELHAALTANRQTDTDLDKEWRFYLLVVKRFSISGLFGIMFDSNNAGPDGADPNSAPREGLAIGTDLQLDNTPNWGVNAGKKFGDAASPFFRTAAHELGHAFGLYHTDADHSFLARTVSILSDSTPTAPFDTQITWNYSPADLKRLRHFPDPYIRPGGIDFGRQTDTHPPITPDDSQVDVPGLALTVTPLRVALPLGAPVRADLTITNHSDTPIPVPQSFGLSSSFTSGTVTDSSNTTRTFRPLASYDRAEPLITLPQGASHTASLTLLGGPDGPLFQSTGLNIIVANVSWTAAGDGQGHRASISLSGKTTVLVTPPVDAGHAAAAYRILTTPQAHTALVLGGDHLEEGNEAIGVAVGDRVLGPHWAVVQARRFARKFGGRKADVERAVEVLEGVEGVVASEAELEGLRGLGVKV
ncbi:hypothetical protein B0T16DRAFT_488161 [Cercophora newfieldiana]|uniref:Peptidase M10 metallopeptidase domain-containing protein n=1 Tax=Cercophora newfieldiana TaxID=92897 RepID=A0AA40D1C5_9PEZI|nr:hypothetical protein B0T16DRAFT_488161 [Cercophora newfieldiana]